MHSGFQTPIVDSPFVGSLQPLSMHQQQQLSLGPIGTTTSSTAGMLPRPGQAPRRESMLSGLSASSRAAAAFNAETNLALDIQSFGLQNQQLQHALSSMLKAIVSLSEDHKQVKGQLENFQNATREAQTAIALDLDSVANKLISDFITKKEWMEGRYDDQRRTDRVAQSFAEYQQEQAHGMTSVLPRLNNSEALIATLREDVARLSSTMAPLDVVDDMFRSRDAAAAENVAINSKRYSTVEAEIQGVRTDVTRMSSSLKTDIGVLTDRVDEAASELARMNHATTKLRSDLDGAISDTAKITRALSAADDAINAELRQHIAATEAAAEALKQVTAITRRADEERLTKAENMFNYQVATFETVLQEHGLRIRSLSGDAETIKGELSASSHGYDVIRASLDTAIAKLSATVDAKASEVNELAASLRRDMASIERNSTKWAEGFRTDMEAYVEDLSTRFKASEQRKKAQDDAFRELISASVSDEAGSITKTLELRLNTRVKEKIDELQLAIAKLAEANDATVAGVAARVGQCEEIAEGAVATVSALGSTVSRIQATGDDASAVAFAVCEVLGMDPAVVRRLASSSSPVRDFDDGGRDGHRARLNRYLRALPWYPRPQSPGRVTAVARDTSDDVNSIQRRSRPGSPIGGGGGGVRVTPAPYYVSNEAALQHRLGDSRSMHQPTFKPQPQVQPHPSAAHLTEYDAQPPPLSAVSLPSSPSHKPSDVHVATAGTDATAVPVAPLPPPVKDVETQQQAFDASAVFGKALVSLESQTSVLDAVGVKRYVAGIDTQSRTEHDTDNRSALIQQQQQHHVHWQVTPPPQAQHDARASSPAARGRLFSPQRPAEPSPTEAPPQSSIAPPQSSIASSSTAAENRGGASGRPKLGIEINNDSTERGVVVIGVEPGGLAERSGIAVGDVVTSLAGMRVSRKEDFVAAFLASVDEGQIAAVVSIIPGGRPTAAATDLTLFYGSLQQHR